MVKKVTEKKALKAKAALSAEFNKRAYSNMVGIGIGEDKNGLFVNVLLKEKAARADKLPKEQDGVRVKYRVSGVIRPQPLKPTNCTLMAGKPKPKK